MKKLTTLLLSTLLGFVAFAQETDAVKVSPSTAKQTDTIKKESEELKSGAKIEFEEETIDYGTIEKGADGIRKFKFTNTGDESLIISRVYSTCGCTVPKKPEAPIAPGETGEIEVKYDTKRVGPIRKTITVYSNAGPVPMPLKIKGTIVPKKAE